MRDNSDQEILAEAIEMLRRALADAREERRLADELLTTMRDRLKSTVARTIPRPVRFE